VAFLRKGGGGRRGEKAEAPRQKKKYVNIVRGGEMEQKKKKGFLDSAAKRRKGDPVRKNTAIDTFHENRGKKKGARKRRKGKNLPQHIVTPQGK